MDKAKVLWFRLSRLHIEALILALAGLPFGCGSPETAPFRQGDYFEYRQVGRDYGHLYRVGEGEDGLYRITWQAGTAEPDELVVSRSGKIVHTPSYPEGSLARDLFHGRQIILWLPEKRRKIGEEVHFCDFLGKNVTTEEKTWRKRDVWVARHSNVFGWQESYFDKGTGLLVGSRSAAGDIKVLHDTNVELPGSD